MRSVSSYEFQMMQKKLERIETTLADKSCHEEIIKIFRLEDIRQTRKNLRKIFSDYTKHYSRLEDIIQQYNLLHNKTASQIRINYRILNRKLDSGLRERELLGLPATRPVRISSPSVATAKGSRSRYFKK